MGKAKALASRVTKPRRGRGQGERRKPVLRRPVAPGTPALAMPNNLSAAERVEWTSLAGELKALGRELTAADASQFRNLVAAQARLRARDLPSATFTALSQVVARALATFTAPPPPPRVPATPAAAPPGAMSPGTTSKAEEPETTFDEVSRKFGFRLAPLPRFTPENYPHLDWTERSPTKSRN
jgi:hypothetical protein